MAGKIASWRPTDQGGLNPPSALGICRNLEDTVKRSPDKWVKDPVRMVETLKHPTYVPVSFADWRIRKAPSMSMQIDL